jgi:hypothetical protein
MAVDPATPATATQMALNAVAELVQVAARNGSCVRVFVLFCFHLPFF